MSLDIDVISQIGAVSRVVDTVSRDGRPARVVRAGRRYDTDIDDLWDALTSAERIPRWFMPISGDLRLGGRYQLQGNAGGEITRCDPPRSLAVTWEYGGDVSWLEVTLAEEESGTRLDLVHTAHVPDELWDRYGPGAVGVGWDQGLVGLARYLETGQAVDPREAMAWVMSAEGRDFVRRSSDGWCRASIAAGTDADAAVAAASRTTAFYTGASEDPSGGEAPAR